MKVADVLREAWVAVEEAELPAEVHEVGFREAVRLLTSSGGEPADRVRQTENKGGSGGDALSPVDEPVVAESEIYDKVVSHTGVDRDALERVVHLDGETLRVSIPGLKLGKNNSERARAVAQIITVTRGFGLGESETSLELIRQECDRLRVYDQNNFSHHMKGLDGYVITGSGANRRIRVKGAGIEAFPDLVAGLTAG